MTLQAAYKSVCLKLLAKSIILNALTDLNIQMVNNNHSGPTDT